MTVALVHVYVARRTVVLVTCCFILGNVIVVADSVCVASLTHTRKLICNGLELLVVHFDDQVVDPKVSDDATPVSYSVFVIRHL